jgi:transcriptional regulator with XRE-family HTH domain
MDELSPDDTAAFGRAVTARRAELGLTRKEVASRSGLSYPYVSNIEAGHKQPSAKALHALATALELRPAELLERSDSLARLAQAADAARSDEDGTSHRGSWFRGDLGIAESRPAPTRDEEMRSMVREVVREELGREGPGLASSIGRVSAMVAGPPSPSPPAVSSAPRPRPLRLPRTIRASLPDWLTKPADTADELAIQSVVLEHLHRLPADTHPDEVRQVIDDALDHLIKQARRRRRKPAQKPK